MLPECLTEITIPRTGVADVPFVMLWGDKTMVLESFFCATMARRGRATFITAIRTAMLELAAEPGWWCEEGRSILICGDEARSRDWVEELVNRHGGRLKPIKGRPGFTVRIAKRKRRRLALCFIAMGAFVALMKEKGLYFGPNPLLIDDWETMGTAGQAAVRNSSPVKSKKSYRADIGRFFRFPFEVWIPVRTSDVRWFDRLRALIRQATKYEAIELYVWIIGVTGCRPGEPQWITFGAWWERGKGFDRLITLRNKGDDGEPEKGAYFIRDLIRMIETYIDGERLLLDPLQRDLAYWNHVGRKADEGCEASRLELDSTYIMLNSMGHRLTYTLVWYHIDKLFDPSKPNPMTLHWLRHEFVFTRMREIERIKDPAVRATKREELCAYMGWATGELMLECYDAYHQKHALRLAYVSFGERREKASAKMAGVADNDDDEDAMTLAPMLNLIMAAAA